MGIASSAIGRQMIAIRRNNTGFTLLELLIVILIISIVTTVGVLSIGKSSGRTMKTVSGEIISRLQLAAEESMLQGVVAGMSIENDRVRFVKYSPAKTADQANWTALDEDALPDYRIPNDVSIALKTAQPGNAPQIIISPSGDMTPFTLTIGMQGQPPHYVISGEADGAISIQTLP